MANSCRLVVLISGHGGNLQAIIDDIKQHQRPATIVGVISDQPSAYGLTRAKQHGIATRVITKGDHPTRQSYDQALLDYLTDLQPDLVILAGFMRIMSEPIVTQYSGRMMNIHPSLLPKYPGLNTHQAAFDAGDMQHGATVHFVTEELDGGPIIIQTSFEIDPEDTVETLEEKTHHVEHVIYPQAIHWFIEGRLKMDSHQVLLDGKPIN